MPALIEIQRDVLLARDARGRLTTTRDPEPQPAPRLFLGRPADANVWALRGDVDAATRTELERLCAAEPRLAAPRAEAPAACRERAPALLAPVTFEYRGPAFVLSERLPHDPRARAVGADDRDAWRAAFPWLDAHLEDFAPVAIAFEDGRAAALCHSPRGRTAQAAEAGVETLEGFRGRGLATAAVACWARAVQRSGRLALYSTTWRNQASRAVARRLSARAYGEDWHVT